jgi:hypothetical protein
MNLTHSHERRVVEQFAELKRRFRIAVTLPAASLLAWIVVAALYAHRDGSTLLGVPLAWAIEGGLVLAAVVGTALSIRYWRCPACDKYMGGALFMSHCPRCGVRLSK